LTTGILTLFGVAFGLGLFTFIYARGFSYLSNDPASCVNCHIMRDQYEGWSHSSHKAVATCNDCHTPHRFPDKWIIKGVNGWNHSVAFTTGNFPDPIRIRGFNANIAQENCVECHATTVGQMHQAASHEEANCIACHNNVGHANEALTGPSVTTPQHFGAVRPSKQQGVAVPGIAPANAVPGQTGETPAEQDRTDQVPIDPDGTDQDPMEETERDLDQTGADQPDTEQAESDETEVEPPGQDQTATEQAEEGNE
jgi:cytochrome c nitrite reductase small subunit